MTFARDTLSTLRQKVLSDIAARLPGSDPFVRRSPLGVLGTVLAGLQDAQFGYLDWQSKEGVPFTSDGEYQVAWGALRAVALEPPVVSVGTATIAGAIPTTPIAIGASQLQRSDGTLYAITTGATVAGDGTATLGITAVVAEAAGDCTPGQVLNFVTPISGIPGTATVVTVGGGADIETTDHFRSRMLTAWSTPPQGGDLADYVKWTMDNVPSVTRAWAGGVGIFGAGTVTVYFMMDDTGHAPNGIPIGTNGVSQYESRDTPAVGDQLLVADAIYPLRPVTALVYAVAPTSVPLNLTIAEVPVDATIRANIALALEGLILREASPAGVQIVRRMANGLLSLQAGGTIPLSHIDDAISAVPGLDHFVLTSPSADVVLSTNGQISTAGSITFS
jgi:uncharacterized phage protein gp47/JayE